MDIYDSESKGIRAQARHDASGFTVLAGSEAVRDSQLQPSFNDKPPRVAKRQQLIRDGQLQLEGNKYIFTRDVLFNSPSEAASIIWGCNLNGRKVFGLDGAAPPSDSFHHFPIESDRAIEGYKQDQQLYLAERDRSLVMKRKERDEFTCQACSFRFSVSGKHVIECHHLYPISLGKRETRIEDLVSLCPNCHRIAHMREPIYSLEELKQLHRTAHST